LNPENYSSMMVESMLRVPLIDFSPLSANPISDFEKLSTHGFLIKKNFFPPDLIDQVKEWTMSYYGANNVSDGRVQDAWSYASCVRSLAAHPMVLELLSSLYGREPIPFQTLNFLRGTEQKTHSDAIHFHSWPQRWMCGVWVALEDVGEMNGPLHYYTGSHRLPILDMHDTGSPSWGKKPSNSDYKYYEIAIQDLIKNVGLKKQQFLPAKGDCMIWAANLLHGGDRILDEKLTRVSQVTHYFFEGCDYFIPRLTNFSASSIHFRDDVWNIATNSAVPSLRDPFALKRKKTIVRNSLSKLWGKIKLQSNTFPTRC